MYRALACTDSVVGSKSGSSSSRWVKPSGRLSNLLPTSRWEGVRGSSTSALEVYVRGREFRIDYTSRSAVCISSADSLA